MGEPIAPTDPRSTPRPDAPASPETRPRRWIVDVACTLDCPPERALEEVRKPALMRHVTAPLVRFQPLDPPAFPERWSTGEYLVRLALFGVVPLGTQTIGIEFPDAADAAVAGPPYRLRDNGRGQLIRVWDHRITLEPTADGKTRYRDRVEVAAGPLTPFVWLFAQLFYRHRQRRWRALAARGFAYPS